MGINLSVPPTTELKPRIMVFGVGGAGGNAVNNMITSGLEGVDFVVANTDAQALSHSLCDRRIQLGATLTQGLGAGARPEIGRQAAEEVLAQIVDQMQGCHMVFVTAGMGGGTGTGAAPVIARAARDQGLLTVGVVTKPFQFEGKRRMTMAEDGIEEMAAFVDTLIVIPNQNLFRIANEKTTFADAFRMADNVLHAGVRGVTDLMVMPGLINLDFADVRTVMSEMGKAMMGTGEADGQNRALEAAERAIANPLLDDVSMQGARGVLINITGGLDLTLYEVDEAVNRIRKEVADEANIIFGSTFDESLAGKMRVSIVATGIMAEQMAQPKPGANITPFRPLPTSRTGYGYATGGGGAAAALAAQPIVDVAEVQPVAETTVAEAAPRLTVEIAEPAAAVDTVMPAPAAPMVQPSPPPAQPTLGLDMPSQPQARPMARPQAEPQRGLVTAQGQFIPPRPVEAPAAREAQRFVAPPVAPQPAAQPAVDPRGSLTARFTKPFSRIFGGGERAEAAPAPQPAAAAAPAVPEPKLQVPARAPQAAPMVPPPAQPQPQPVATAEKRPSLNLEPGERIGPREEDQWEIPAFLRRQAN